MRNARTLVSKSPLTFEIFQMRNGLLEENKFGDSFRASYKISELSRYNIQQAGQQIPFHG